MPSLNTTLKANFAATVAACALLASGQAVAAEWSDTAATYQVGSGYKFPQPPGTSAPNVKVDIYSLVHVSGYQYGVNFFLINRLKSDDKDGSAVEFYGVYRNTLSFSKISGKQVGFGPVKDVGIQAGFDVGTKSDGLQARPVKKMIGPSFSFDVPGMLTVTPFWRQEDTHNGTGAPGSSAEVHHKSQAAVSVVWGFPFSVGSLPASFNGFLDHASAKGKDIFGVHDTKPETILDMNVMFDVGSLGGKKGTYLAGIGYEAKKNAFGMDPQYYGTGGTGSGTSWGTYKAKFEVHF